MRLAVGEGQGLGDGLRGRRRCQAVGTGPSSLVGCPPPHLAAGQLSRVGQPISQQISRIWYQHARLQPGRSVQVVRMRKYPGLPATQALNIDGWFLRLSSRDHTALASRGPRSRIRRVVSVKRRGFRRALREVMQGRVQRGEDHHVGWPLASSVQDVLRSLLVILRPR